MRKIAISSGHAKNVRGARGNPVPPELDERDENVKVVDRVAQLLQQSNVPVVKFHDNVSTSQNENLNRIVSWHNSQSRDLDVSVHFNAGGNDNLMGTEVLWVTQKSLAAEVSAAIAGAANWPNRGDKERKDLAFLNGTTKPAILIEVCFCDSVADSNRYRERFEDICIQIAEHISDVALKPPGPEPEPPKPEPEPGEAGRVEIVATGNVVVLVNGKQVFGPAPADSVPANQRGIKATWFGGSKDPNNSAYDGKPLNDSDYYVALPVNVADAEQRKRGVRITAGGKTLVGAVRDKGPWLTDDDAYVFGDERPLAETCWKNQTPLPRGPNKGKIPNGAGIDLSPALFRDLGEPEKVDWKFA